MKQKCENCDKIYPDESKTWYECTSIKRGGGCISPGDPYPEPLCIKLCSDCYEKLDYQEKSKWQIVKKNKTEWDNLPKHKTEWDNLPKHKTKWETEKKH